MTIFDLLFMFIVLASVAALITVVVAALRGERARALRILRRFGICAVAYVAIVAVVALLSPRRILNVGDPWCFDDWCLSVAGVNRTAASHQVLYNVSLRLFSRARRVSQRAGGAWIYLVDQGGNRYAPEPDPAAVPLDVLLHPGESVATSRVFKLPAEAGEIGLITGHGGPCCFPNFIIADDSSLFHKRTYVRISGAQPSASGQARATN